VIRGGHLVEVTKKPRMKWRMGVDTEEENNIDP
jgi:hypothetical protein